MRSQGPGPDTKLQEPGPGMRSQGPGPDTKLQEPGPDTDTEPDRTQGTEPGSTHPRNICAGVSLTRWNQIRRAR
jgi:hypothetical protein